MQKIEEFTKSLDSHQLLEFCENKEVEEAGQVTKDSELNYILLILSYALKDDMSNVKFTWKRIPKDLKKRSKDLGALWKVIHALWSKDNKSFFVATEYSWQPAVAPWMNALTDTIRAKYRTLIAKGYSSISVDLCCQLLGLPKEKLPTYVPKWSIDKGFVVPVPETPRKDQSVSVRQIAQLTDAVVNLETLS